MPNGAAVWVAFVTDASGTSQVVVRPFPGPGGQVQVSVTGGTEPVWAPDGRRLFYVSSQAPHANYDVSLEGSRFLMVKSVQSSKLVVVYGWLGELRLRMRSAEAR